MIEPVTFEPTENDGFLIGAVSGELDMATAPGLRRELAAAVPNTARGVLLDLSEVPYIDSAGIRLLFSLADSLTARRQVLRLIVPEDAAIRSVLNLVDIDGIAPTYASLDDALAARENAPLPGA